MRVRSIRKCKTNRNQDDSMTTMTWGLLGPDALGEERRTRTLGLGRAVRSFNELAVPGLGGVWLGKHLFLATLGVRVAQEARALRKHVTNIEVANSVEALACWYGLRSSRESRPDPRLRGFRKLGGKDDVAFAKVRAPGFYVSQPMRMSVGQALPSLGLVEAGSSRFNTFSCTPSGEALIAAQSAPYNPCQGKRNVVEYLVDWVRGHEKQPNAKKLGEALSPLVTLSGDARAVVFERLRLGGSRESALETQRRRASLVWVESLRKRNALGFSWEDMPDAIGDFGHWHDLEAGALFFQTRDAALAVLDALERHIGESCNGLRHSLHGKVPSGVAAHLERLRLAASAYRKLEQHAAASQDPLRLQHADAMADAAKFCRECVEANDNDVLRKLVERDERVLHLKGMEVVPGPAFNGGLLARIRDGSDFAAGQGEDEGEGEGEDVQDTRSPPSRPVSTWPDGLSYRVRNLFLLNADLLGKLDEWRDVASVNGEGL
jgi:hypothetical protein